MTKGIHITLFHRKSSHSCNHITRLQFPTPDLSWIVQGDLLYQGPEDGEVLLIHEFFIDPPSRTMLAPDSVFPSVLSTDIFGDIELNFRAKNLILPFSILPHGVTLDKFGSPPC